MFVCVRVCVCVCVHCVCVCLSLSLSLSHSLSLTLSLSHSLSPSPSLPKGVFIVPNEPIKADVDLTSFQVSLDKLESQTGSTFHPSLDRRKVKFSFVLKWIMLAVNFSDEKTIRTGNNNY